MKTISKTILALGIFATALISTASADGYHRIDDLAQSIARKTRLIVKETEHYRHTAEYRYLLSDAREICRLADRMHEAARYRGSIAQLSSDLRELDAQFYHLAGLFDRIERNASYGHGQIHGHTGHVKSLLNSIERDIRYLQDAIAPLRRQVTLKVPIPRAPVYPTPSVTRWSGYKVAPSSSFGRPTKSLTPSSNYGRADTRRTSVKSQGVSKSFRSPSPSRSYKSNSRTISIGGGRSRVTVRL